MSRKFSFVDAGSAIITAVTVALFLVAAIVPRAAGAVTADDVEAYAKRLGTQIATINKGRYQNSKPRLDKLEALLRPQVDWGGMVEFMVGAKVWNAATDGERREAASLFADTAIKTIREAFSNEVFVDFRWRSAEPLGNSGDYQISARVKKRMENSFSDEYVFWVRHTPQGFKVLNVALPAAGVNVLTQGRNEYMPIARKGGLKAAIAHFRSSEEVAAANQ